MNHFTNILAKKFEKENWNTVAAAINPGNFFDTKLRSL